MSVSRIFYTVTNTLGAAVFAVGTVGFGGGAIWAGLNAVNEEIPLLNMDAAYDEDSQRGDNISEDAALLGGAALLFTAAAFGCGVGTRRFAIKALDHARGDHDYHL